MCVFGYRRRLVVFSLYLPNLYPLLNSVHYVVLIELLLVWRKFRSLDVHFDDLFKLICEIVQLQKNAWYL